MLVTIAYFNDKPPFDRSKSYPLKQESTLKATLDCQDTFLYREGEASTPPSFYPSVTHA